MTRSNRFIHFALMLSIVCACFCLSQIANAATANVTINYVRANTYVDGTPLPASSITGHAVDCSFTPTGGTAALCALTGSPFPGSVQSGTVVVTYPPVGGQACFALKTLVGSNSSNGSQPPVCVALPAIKPGDPTNVTVTITLAINLQSDTPIRVAVAEPVVTRSP
jgi:hypothetical protein